MMRFTFNNEEIVVFNPSSKNTIDLNGVRRGYLLNFGSNTVTVVEENFEIKETIPVGNRPSGLAITPDQRHVCVANFGGNMVSVISTEQNKGVIREIDVGQGAVGVATSADSQNIYVANTRTGTIASFRIADGERSWSTPVTGMEGALKGVATSQEGDYIIVPVREAGQELQILLLAPDDGQVQGQATLVEQPRDMLGFWGDCWFPFCMPPPPTYPRAVPEPR